MCCLLSVLSHFSHVQLFATLWTVAHPVPLSMGFSRQEDWGGLPCPSPLYLKIAKRVDLKGSHHNNNNKVVMM